jgi:hypothetical protein
MVYLASLHLAMGKDKGVTTVKIILFRLRHVVPFGPGYSAKFAAIVGSLFLPQSPYCGNFAVIVATIFLPYACGRYGTFATIAVLLPQFTVLLPQ